MLLRDPSHAATKCLLCCYEMAGTEVAYGGTEIAYAATGMALRGRVWYYEVHGTEVGYGATR
eukprot:2531522-Rhodomonas_salina.1